MKYRTVADLESAVNKFNTTKLAYDKAIAAETARIDALEMKYIDMLESASPEQAVAVKLDISDAENRVEKLKKSLEELMPFYSNSDVDEVANNKYEAYRKSIAGTLKKYAKARDALAEAYVELIKAETNVVEEFEEIASFYYNETPDQYTGVSWLHLPQQPLGYTKLRNAHEFDAEFKKFYKPGELNEKYLYNIVNVGRINVLID